jgi:predicted RNase H-like HicB family nuclease
MISRYPIAIEPGTADSAWGVVVPDLPGCFSAGDSLDEAVALAEEAVAAWLDSALDLGMTIPPPSTLESLRERPEFSGWVFAVVAVSPAWLDDAAERVNITLPKRVLARIDADAKALGLTRSGYIASLSTGLIHRAA